MSDRAVLPRGKAGTARSVFRLVLLAVVVALTLIPAVQAQNVRTGTLEGQVVNGTAEGEQIGAGLTVNLYVLGDALTDEVLSTVTDSDGSFRFEGLDTSTEAEYWVEAVYKDIPYGGDALLQYADGQTALEVTVTVYETTADDSGVQLDLVHVFAESFGQVLRISETHLFGSADDRTYIGEVNDEGQRLTVFVPMAGDVVGFSLGEESDADRFLVVEGGLVDSEPVRPGALMSEVGLSYHLLVTGEPITLERSFAYPVADLTVLVAQPGLTVSSAQLQSMGTQSIQGSQYEILTGQMADPGQVVVLEFAAVEGAVTGKGTEAMGSQTASSGPAGSTQRALLWIGVAVALLTVFAVAFLAARFRSEPAGHLVASDRGPSLAPAQRRLIARLADLEDAYEAGEVDEADYVQRRMEILRELG